MKQTIFFFLIILSGCASQKTIVNNDEVYEVINSFTTKNKDSDLYSPFKITKNNFEHDWSKYFNRYDIIIRLIDSDDNLRLKIKKKSDSIINDKNLNKKVYDSVSKKYKPAYILKLDSLEKRYKSYFRTPSDSLFSEKDFEYMKKQIQFNAKKIKWDKAKLKNVIFTKKGRKLAIPIFSKDGKKAILYSESSGGQLDYFIKENGEWKHYGVGGLSGWMS